MIIILCDGCGKRLFEHMSENHKKTSTLWEIEQLSICSDCMLREAKQNQVDEETNDNDSQM